MVLLRTLKALALVPSCRHFFYFIPSSRSLHLSLFVCKVNISGKPLATSFQRGVFFYFRSFNWRLCCRSGHYDCLKKGGKQTEGSFFERNSQVFPGVGFIDTHAFCVLLKTLTRCYMKN